MSNGDGHSRRCEEAVGHKCVCTVCGGARHGWPGWLGLATESEDGPLQVRTERVQRRWDRFYDPGKSRQRKPVREACIDFARLDIIGWLRSKRTSSMPTIVPHVEPSSTLDGAPGRWVDGSAGPAGRKSGDPSAGRRDRAGPSADGIRRGETEGSQPPVDDPADQALKLAEVVAIPAWHSVRDILDDEGRPDAVLIKTQLASHTWCDLFLGMALSVEQMQGALDNTPQAATRYVLHSSMHAQRSAIDDRIIELLVDEAWKALLSHAVDHVAGLGLITGMPLLRSLRILAYLSCPEPAAHREVRQHALRQLGKDAEGILRDETKRLLEALFEDWAA